MIVPGEPTFLNQPDAVAPFNGAITLRSPMLSPSNAWRILERRTGFNIGRSTFYRWIQMGRVFSLKLGGKVYIPWAEVENVIKECRSGRRD